jgi:high frequency lysogenization protein
MSKPPSRDQIIALAGLFQACALVDTLARTGHIQPEALNTALASLLEQNPASCEATFGSVARLSTGFDAMEKLLDSDQRSKAQDILRYALGLIYLQGKVLKNTAMLNKIGEGIARANNQAQHFSPDHDNVISSLADLYSNTISTYRFRIQVNGQGGFLQQANIAKRIRCLLFSGIRASILWHQMGGRRWHFVFYRKQMLEQIQQLRREC